MDEIETIEISLRKMIGLTRPLLYTGSISSNSQIPSSSLTFFDSNSNIIPYIDFFTFDEPSVKIIHRFSIKKKCFLISGG